MPAPATIHFVNASLYIPERQLPEPVEPLFDRLGQHGRRDEIFDGITGIRW
jgi:hypothetical protein